MSTTMPEIKAKVIMSNSFFILFDLWLIVPLRYREWDEKKNSLNDRAKAILIVDCKSLLQMM